MLFCTNLIQELNLKKVKNGDYTYHYYLKLMFYLILQQGYLNSLHAFQLKVSKNNLAQKLYIKICKFNYLIRTNTCHC